MRPASALLVVALVVGLALAATGCGHDSHASAWCTLAKKHNEVFNTNKPGNPKALAAFQRIATQAPRAIRSDVIIVVSYVIHFSHGEVAYLLPPRINTWRSARDRVDAYLHKECGVTLPATGQSS